MGGDMILGLENVVKWGGEEENEKGSIRVGGEFRRGGRGGSAE